LHNNYEEKKIMTDKAVIDIQAAVEQLGDLDFYFELVDEFITDIAVKKPLITNSISSGNADDLKLASHSIKGVSANLQLSRIKNAAADLENAVKQNRNADYKKLADLLFLEFDKLIQERTAINESI